MASWFSGPGTWMISTRQGRPDDAETVARMAHALSQVDGGKPSKFTADAFARDGFGESAAFRSVIAEWNGEPAGYAVYYMGYDTDTATKGAYLADLYVAEHMRRRGVGRALVAAVADRCRADGGRWMFWSVLKRNRAARRFYKRIAPELRDVIVCAAFGKTFDQVADQSR